MNSDGNSTTKKWAVGQIDAGLDIQENLDTAIRFIRSASQAGCGLIAFPEFFLLRGDHESIRQCFISVESTEIERLRECARSNEISILAGSIPSPDPTDSDFCYNTSLLIDQNGEIRSTYRKIHLFDVEIEDELEILESNLMNSGEEITTGAINGTQTGLTICYDLRFPEIYRRLSREGVEVIFVPSNFTRETGRAHWEPLLQARAIENQAYVVAPNQIGTNRDTGIASLGQSMVVDPWGQIIAKASDREMWFSVELDFGYLREIREQLPALEHRSIE